MKFIFKNLGPIHEAELELGDLTIIAGRNNTGKTYVAYTLYGFLQMWTVWPPLRKFLDEVGGLPPSSSTESRFPDLKEAARVFMEERQVKFSVEREEFNEQRRAIIREAARVFSEEAWVRVFSSSDAFEGASVDIVVENDFPAHAEISVVHLSSGNEFMITYSDAEMCVSRSPGGRVSSPDTLSSTLLRLYLSFLFPELPNPFILSAERFGISLFYKELDFTKNRLVEVLQEMGKDRGRERFEPYLFIHKAASRYALPIRDNIDYTRSIPDLQKQKNELYDSKLFNDIRDMLGGYYRSSGDEIRLKSKARKGGFDIPLHIASSSARGLSDLYFFLRHVAEKGQLLIIDEPESHLDTANQIQFARLLAHAVNAGLKVLITTHSDYIVKEINNLLMLSQDFEEKDEVLKKLKYSEHDYLKPESVRAYVAEKNSLTPCTIEKYGIDMPVFDTTIDKINRVSSELESRLTYEGEE